MNEKEAYDKMLEDLAELTDLVKVLRPYDGEAPGALRNLARKKAAAVCRGISELFPEEENTESYVRSSGEAEEPEVFRPHESTDEISGMEFVPIDNEKGKPLPETAKSENCPDRMDDRNGIREFHASDTAGIPLEELLSRRLTRDLKKAISLNDWFRFKRELFGDNENLMDSTITYLNGLGSFDEAGGYIRKAFSWDMDSAAAQDFMNILEKRFS